MFEDMVTWLTSQEPETLLILLAVVVALGYPVSLWLHPWRRCLLCRGSPRKSGAIYTYAWRNCRRCGGTGRELRLGVRATGIGRPKGG